MKWELAAIVLALIAGPVSAMVPKGSPDVGCLVGVLWFAACALMIVGLVV